MANKKKCAIVKFVAREGSVVKFCALLPQLEKYDEDYFQTPPGFNLIVLPWADDIRSNSDILSKNPKILPKVSEEQSELAKKLIKKMNISFDCRAFENFELQKFYSTLQALALEEPNIEPIEDTLQPHTEGLEKVLNGLDEEFRKSIFGNSGGKTSEVCEKYVKGNRNKKTRSRSKSKDSKSSKSSGNKRGGRKKKKDVDISDEDEKEEQGANYSDEIIKKMMKNKKLEKMTVPELKDICRIRNISTKGLKKVDILEKIKNYLEDE